MDKRRKSAFPFLFYLIIGFVVFVVFSHIRPLFLWPMDLAGRLFVMVFLLLASLKLKGMERYQDQGKVFYAFFTASAALCLDYYLPTSKWLLEAMQIGINTPIGIALDKFDSSMIIIATIILLTRLSGGNLASLYLKKGDLKQGLTIGIIAFVISMIGSIYVANLFGAQNLTLERIYPWLPWILIFICFNAINEELLFRGLLLGKVQPILGRFCSNLVLAIPFVLHHTGVTYTTDALLFLAYLLPLSLAWGYITQKTDSLLGAFLFHAGTDIPVILVIFSRLP
ncbi:MAG: CPBP family intramembrane glutamic endopeptidase [Clostridiaceae bacterium]